MTLNEQIIAAVTPVVPVCVPDLLVTEAGETPPEEYCTFDYTQTAGLSGDDGIDVGLARVQLHYFSPLKASTVAKRRTLAAAIEAVDTFSLPTITPATDEFGQHYVFEFDALADEDDDGAV
nr:MAG TPA: hypothetical protein [Caudoviricetes sp.]